MKGKVFTAQEAVYNLAVALIDMLEQHARTGSDGQLFDDGLSANEGAIDALWKIGIINQKEGKDFINFEKLEQLKN